MRVPLTLKINGGPLKTDRELRLQIRSVELRSMQADVVQGNWVRKLGQACPLAQDDEVDLYIGERRIFTGRVQLGAISPNGVPFKIKGPWSHLEEFIYHHNLGGGILNWKVGDVITTAIGEGVEIWNGSAWVPIDGEIEWTIGTETIYDYETPNVGTLNINQISTSRVRFFPPPGALTVFAQITRLLTYFQNVTDSAHMDIATLELGVLEAVSYRTVQDVSVAEGIRQAMATKPDAAFWFDYDTGGLPVLYCQVVELETPLELTPGAADVPGYGITRLDDLKVNGVVLRFEVDASLETGQGKPYACGQAPADAVCYERRMAVQTVAEFQSQGSLLALPLYEKLSADKARGSVPVLDLDFSLGLRPGRLLRVVDDELLTGYDLWVQTVTWNPGTGLAEVSVGYPEDLSLQELMQLRRYLLRCFYPPGHGTRQITQILGF